MERINVSPDTYSEYQGSALFYTTPSEYAGFSAYSTAVITVFFFCMFITLFCLLKILDLLFYYYYLYFKKYLFIYLAAPGLSCGILLLFLN